MWRLTVCRGCPRTEVLFSFGRGGRKCNEAQFVTGIFLHMGVIVLLHKHVKVQE